MNPKVTPFVHMLGLVFGIGIIEIVVEEGSLWLSRSSLSVTDDFPFVTRNRGHLLMYDWRALVVTAGLALVW